MNRKILILLFIILHFTFFIRLAAQDTWVQTYQPFGDVDYFPEDIVVCQDSGYAVNGYYYYYDPEFGIEEEWGFLMKTDSDGNLLWAKLDTLSFMGETRSNAFVETSDGGFISAISNGILIKRDSNGNREWITQCDIGINSMYNTDDGYIILGGASNLNIALSKINEEGNTIWTQIYPIDDDYSICKSIIQTNDGGYALTGYLDYEGRQIADILVMKTDANGDSLWTRTFDGYGLWDTAFCIAENCAEDLFVSGYFTGSSRVLYGVFIKLSNTGDLLFLLDENNCGYNVSMRSMVDTITNNIVGNGRIGSDLALHSFNYSGDNVWNSILPFDYPALGDRGLQKINNGFIVYGANDFENILSIVKTDSQGQVNVINEFEIPYIDEITLSNYPNPFNPETKIIFNLPANIENPIIEIFNIKGEKIRVINCQNQMPIIWDGTDNFRKQVSSGIYLYRLKTNNFVSKAKKMTLLK